MSNIQYDYFKDESIIIDKINSLVDLSKKELKETQDMYMEDLYLWSALDKSLKLIDSFLFALKQRNITILAALTRIQMDCVLRTYATTLVNDSNEFCKNILLENGQVNSYTDINNKHLTDKYLCISLGNILNLPLYDLYKKVCGYVHFSSSSFFNAVRTDGDNGFTMTISKNNQNELSETYERLSIELANHFYYFGKILIIVFIRSWQEQKEDFIIKPNN